MADEEPRRYQTRARSRIAEDHISTKSIPTKPPAPSSKSLRNATVAAKSVEITLKTKISSSATTAKTAATATTATTVVTAVRPTRKAASATAGAFAKKETVPKTTSIPVPTRTTRSGKAAAVNNFPKTTENDKEQKLPSRKATTVARGKKKALSEDKENQGPASEIEAELKQQEMTAADSQPSNLLSQQPVRKLASGGTSLGTPIKNAIRPIGSLRPKEPEATLFSPPKRTHQLANMENVPPDSVDDLEGPISVGLQSQARRPNNPVRLHPPEQVNLLASPPRRNAPQHTRPDRPLPAMVLTFDQPALLMQSPAKRGSGVGQSPMRGVPGKLAMPPKMDLLSSPPKRPVKKPINEVEVEKEVDELSLDIYRIENSPKRPVLTKGQSLVPLIKEPKQAEDLFMSKKEHAPASASAKTDVEGDVEMTDVDSDMEDVIASPCPANHSQSQSFGLFGKNEDWDLSPTSERGVTPLVTGLEDLSMGLEGSRRSLFPKHKGQEKSIALEDSAQLEIRHGNEENTMIGTIPIDPMLLEEDFTEGRGPRKISTKTGNDSNKNKERHRSNVLAGAVVYVDVYLPENPTASNTLMEMLHGMGAKTVQQWAWNPTAGSGGAGKIGITHVVFKDGSSTTLQKVTESKGVVMCVDIGWVIECDKEQKWIDEGLFLIDSDDALMNAHRRRSIEGMGPMVVSHHSSRSSSAYSSTPRQFHVAVDGAPAPVIQNTNGGSPFGISDTQPSSFAGPQVDRLGFYIGRDANQPVSLMEKLILVRRKSLKYAPKVGSPLGKNCQWADY